MVLVKHSKKRAKRRLWRPKFLTKMSGRLHHEVVRSDYETSYAVILSLMRWVLALMSLIIRSWYSVF
jgi:hypothetical protein